MLNDDPLCHPDVDNKTRYCLGTRIQMKSDGKGSHKANECTFHNLDLSEEGKMIKVLYAHTLFNSLHIWQKLCYVKP